MTIIARGLRYKMRQEFQSQYKSPQRPKTSLSQENKSTPKKLRSMICLCCANSSWLIAEGSLFKYAFNCVLLIILLTHYPFSELVFLQNAKLF